jgi:hypothetical protein
MHDQPIGEYLFNMFSFLQRHRAQTFGLGMAGIDEVTRVLNGEDGLVRLCPFRRLLSVGRDDVCRFDVLILEETVGGLCFRPVFARLIDGAFGRF